jgi:hypothetical protein
MLRRESLGAEVSQWFTAGSQTLQVDRLHLHLSADKKGNVVSLRGSYSSTSNHEGAFREMKQKNTTNNVCNKCRMDYWILYVCMYVCMYVLEKKHEPFLDLSYKFLRICRSTSAFLSVVGTRMKLSSLKSPHTKPLCNNAHFHLLTDIK